MERYAVDFGTSNTVVARWNFAKEEPQTMSFPAITAPGSGAMPPVTPSVLYYRGEESFLMGYEVTSRGLDDIRSSRYFWGFKRGLLHLTSLYEDRGREFSADHIARLYLTRLLGNLELNADTVVTFTAPVNAFDTYREWISAFFAENYPDVPYRLVDESVAAAISYGSTRAGSVVCVVDLAAAPWMFRWSACRNPLPGRRPEKRPRAGCWAKPAPSSAAMISTGGCWRIC